MTNKENAKGIESIIEDLQAHPSKEGNAAIHHLQEAHQFLTGSSGVRHPIKESRIDGKGRSEPVPNAV